MKNIKLVLFSFSIAGLFLVSSCTKCETCTQTITTTTKTSTPTPGYPTTDVSTSTFEACGDNLKQADGSTYNSTASSGGITVTSTMRTNCY
jgi:hypothetical protein